MISPEKLRQIRRRWRWSQENLGDALGVNRRTVMRYENGIQPIPKAFAACVLLMDAYPAVKRFILTDGGSPG